MLKDVRFVYCPYKVSHVIKVPSTTVNASIYSKLVIRINRHGPPNPAMSNKEVNLFMMMIVLLYLYVCFKDVP